MLGATGAGSGTASRAAAVAGFAVKALPRDARRPDVQRYRCVLAVETG